MTSVHTSNAPQHPNLTNPCTPLSQLTYATSKDTSTTHIIESNLSTKPIKRPPLSLQRIHNIQTRDRLALSVLRIGDCIADDAFEEGLEDTAGFFVDHCQETLFTR